MSLALDTDFQPNHGVPVPVAPGIVRLTAPNTGPLTFTGTNTYLVGEETVVVIDPGPDDDAHFDALLATIAGRSVEAVLITHTHLDHTGLCRRLRSATEAPFLAEGPHRTSRALGPDEINLLDAAADHGFQPDRRLVDGEILETRAGRFIAVATPGHTANHMAFALDGTGLLFSGDHVMAWSTTVVAPPDGSMSDYMASLDRLAVRNDMRYLPGHGGPVEKPAGFLRAMRAHRRMREQAILERLRVGDRHVPEIVAALYRTTPVRLHGAAGLSVLAHLEDLANRHLVRAENGIDIRGRFSLA